MPSPEKRRPSFACPILPYAQSDGPYDGPWVQYRDALAHYWRSYLDGQLDFDTAIARVVAAL